jgi:F-type H+-transporting ATPase subunit b
VLIDWFTVGAQAVNFLVLLWLMQRFLYKPILAAIAAREKRIADELSAAGQQKTEADRIRRDLSAKSQAFDGERATLLAQAVASAAVEHARLIAESRSEADALQLKHQAQWQKERAAQSDRVSELVTTEVFAIARRALSDLAGIDLEECMVARLVTRLHDLSSSAKPLWLAALQGDQAGAIVRSRFELKAPLRVLIQTAVNAGGPTVPLRFETASNSVGGIEIIGGGQRLAWTIADYLESLQAQVEALGISPIPSPGAAQSAASRPTIAPLAVAS